MRKTTSTYIFLVLSFWVSTSILFGAKEPAVFGNKSSHIVVIPPPVTAGTFPDICQNGKAFLLTGGSPSGGYYTGQGVINGYFYPSSAGAGTHTITYTVYVGGVPQTATTTIKVNPRPAYPSVITSGTLPFVGTNGQYGGSACPNGGYAYSTPGCTGKTENYIIPPEAGTTYKWEPSSKYGKTYSGGGSIVGSNTGNSVDIKWDSSGVNKIYTSGGSRYYYSLFKVTATNSFGCTDSFFLFFQINIAPKADFTATTVCVGNETQFTDNSADATQWFWDFGDGTTSTEKNPKHVFTTGGPHTVKLTTKSGCYCETTVTKTVNVISTPAPKVTCPSTFCPGTSSSYSTDPVCGGYNWVVNGGTIASGQGTPNITVNWGPNGPTGTVSLTTSGCNPNQCSSPTTNTVPLIPPVSSIAGKTKVCQYEAATYNMPSFPGSNVSWSIVPATAGTINDGQGTNTVDITWNTSGNAKIVVTIDHAILGCKSSTTLDVIILPYFSVSTTTYSLCKGGSGTITASPSGGMTWTIPDKKGTITSGQGTGSVVINWPYAGSHMVIAKPTTANKYCNDSSYTYVYVDSVRPPSVDGPLYICPGSTYKYTSLGPTSPYSYNWTATNGTITSTSGNDVWIKWGTTGPYSFTVKQNNGYAPYCSSAPLVIPVYDLTSVPPPIKGKDSTCVDNTYTYSVPYLTGATYAWSISPPQFASIITGQGTSAISLEFSSAGTAVITCKTTLCPTPMVSTFTVTINPSPKPPISSVGYMCPTNGSVTLSTSPGYSTYSWSPSGGTGQTAVVTTDGYYIVYVKGKNGCVGKEKIEVPMQEAPMAHISSEDPHNYGCIVPNTVNTTLRALQGGGNGSVTYQWYHKGTPVGTNSPSYTALDSGKYWLVVTNSYGCITTSNPFYISRISCGTLSGSGPPGPPGNGSSSSGAVGAAGAGGVGAGDLRPVPVGGGDKFGGGVSTMSNISSGSGDDKVLATQIICVRNIQFSNTSPDATDRWSWEFGDFTSIDTNENPLHLYAMPGYYYITFWTHFALPKTGWKAQYIPIEIPYKAAFKYKPNCGGAIFTDKSMHTSGSPITNWNWDFGDGNTSTAQNPGHTYAAPGTYTVVLSISGSVCTRTTSQTVTIPPKPTAEFTAPSACITFPTKFTDGSTGTSLYEWKWEFGDGYISNNQNPYHTYGSPGNYTVKLTVTDVTGCSSTVTHTVVVSSPSGGASITANGPTTFCRGGTVLLTATAAASYQWSNGATSQYILVNQTGYYSCTITFATGCVVKIPQVYVKVLSTPSAYMYSNVNGFICAGTTASYSASYSKNFSYQWYKNGVAISGATTYTYTTSTTGIYRVHVVDKTTGCFVDPPEDTITSIQPSPTMPTITGPGSFCDGTTITLVGSSSGGTPPLTYEWTNGSTQTSITVNTGGTQYLTVQDKNGCYKTANKDIKLNPKPNLNGFPVGCYEMCKRDTLRVLGGMASYQWYLNGVAIPAPKGTSQNMIVTDDGAYRLVAKTTAGCIDTSAKVDITTKPLPVAICVAGGEVDSLKGTTDGITYNWTPTTGLSNPNILNPIAKPASTTDYILRAKGSNGCKNSDTVKVTVSCTNPKVTVAGNITCKAGCVSLTATGGGGGIKPYSYKWSSGQTGLGPHSVCPASTIIYTVTITDAAGNTGKDTALVVVKPGITSITSAKVDIKCKGAANGTLSVTPTGGIAPYTYSWSTGASAQTITGLSAMTYSVSIIDSLGCKRDTVLTIAEPDSIKPVTATTPAACGGNNGSMSVTVSGGQGPYTYSWSPLGGTGQTAANVPTGNYVVTITDANNCSTTTTAIVNSAGGMTGSINSFNDATCNGAANGSASVTTSGGTAPLIYSWSPIGGTGDTANSLSAGTYTVTVTDVNNCIVVTTVTISEPAIIGLTTTSTDANCGNSNGSATVAATGGTGVYTYLWTPGGATGATASGLSAGNYDVSITDASGCSSTTAVTINNLSGPAVTTQSTDILCYGAADGTAQVNVTGGTGSYTYSWQPSGSTTNSLSGLTAGTYTINVNDGGGCLISSTVTITEPVQINVSVSTTDAACGSANGSAVVTATGGAGTLSYSWQPSGGTAITASNLAAASYTVIVTDGNNCSVTQTGIVNNIGSPVVSIQSSADVTCNGVSDGTASVTSSGGITPYTYSWSPLGGTGSTAGNLSAGIYTVTVTDANNCASFTTVTITEPTIIQLSTSTVDANCGGSNGSATVTAAGGTGSYNYSWTPGGAATSAANGLSAGSYDVMVTDANGCTNSTSVTINNLSGPTIMVQSTDILCYGAADGTAQVNATGGTGSYTYSWQPSGNTTASVSGLPPGTYTASVNDAGGCLITSTVTITESPQINVSVAVTDAACGSANGSAVLTATGGAGTLSYSWQPSGGTAITASNLAAASYTVIVTDGNNCSVTQTAIVNNIGSPVISVQSSSNVTCSGVSDGTASVTSTGGITPYARLL
ncbi:MAG: PKD domain-containing protein [Bacteroidetes bacterium]|nr:PKD domain-containing protein [Bacteroidota bacterium]